MADIDAATMHEDFPRWYGAVSLDDDQARRQARWEGVSAIVGDADRNMVEGLLRLAHGSRQKPAGDVVEAVRQAFKASDDRFEMSGNDRELQILAGACLAVLIETQTHIGAVAGLMVTTAGMGDARQPDLPMELAALAEEAIVRHSEGNRMRPSFQNHLSIPKLDFGAAADKVTQEQSWESVAEAFKHAASRTNGAIRRITEARANDIRAIHDFLRAQDEELNMLWWLTGQWSSHFKCSFGEIPSDAQPLVLASELANNTEFLPGPPSVEGILSRAGLKEQESVPITFAVSAADSNWLQGLVGDMDSSVVTTPLHAAIERQLETGAGDAWVAGWAASAAVNPNLELSRLALGKLFYRERLLLLESDG